MVSRLSTARKKPLLIGLTGNFGAGKSTVARFFREKGGAVVNADQLVHEAYRVRSRLYQKLRSLFPELKGRLDRRRIARIVFRDARKRRSLERLTHPYVFSRIREEIRKKPKPVVILEVPLLFESGYYRQTDCNVVVRAKTEEVLKRLARRGYPETEIKTRWRAQMPLSEKIRRADYVIDNSDGFKRTREQVVQVWKQIERSLSKHGQRKRKQ